ncbi:hypothetical protein IGB42_00801 [Andreprevotia sp. IGB-42]|uniref:hypothetical protein n=1 Tax=Andreprevotia sp. IGB-42 TaxID=2497473 RepID=UPI00135990EE|nr:hypothetical protein [Andreprevotia sp. IGB-42]KAF0814746.1 hypothetical protein IGB42_00801 [Andreprevotia sp. IGB-42]
MTVLAIFFSVLSASCFYLAASQQRVLAVRWKRGRITGLIMLLPALACWLTAQGSSAGIAGFLAVMMLCWVLLPAATLLPRRASR